MEWSEIEGLASWAYREAGLEEDVPAAPTELAGRLLGTGAIQRVHGLRVPAVLSWDQGGWRIYLRRRPDGVGGRWLVAHELAEWLLRAGRGGVR